MPALYLGIKCKRRELGLRFLPILRLNLIIYSIFIGQSFSVLPVLSEYFKEITIPLKWPILIKKRRKRLVLVWILLGIQFFHHPKVVVCDIPFYPADCNFFKSTFGLNIYLFWVLRFPKDKQSGCVLVFIIWFFFQEKLGATNKTLMGCIY